MSAVKNLRLQLAALSTHIEAEHATSRHRNYAAEGLVNFRDAATITLMAVTVMRNVGITKEAMKDESV